MGDPTYFVDDLAVAAREAEVVDADFDNGCNMAGSNACGIGINIDEGEIVGTPEQFTLLDQRGLTRQGQLSQSIGGYPYTDPAGWPSSGGTEGFDPEAVVRTGTNPTNAEKEATEGIDGTIVPVGTSNLVTLLAGWVAVP